ncbi:hypothetical protein V8F20_005857 [Naviculisporaceae sp. PSN 640]
MSSEDELMSFATEPMAYEFQSELSDSDQDDHHEGPGPVTADIVTTDIAAETAPASDPAMSTSTIDRDEPPNLAELAASALNGIMNETVAPEKLSSGPRVVDIQVSVPWLPPNQRDDFLFIEPEEDDLRVSRSRRNKVRWI